MDGHIALNNSEACVQAGLSGLGIVQLAAFTVGRYIESGRLETVLDDWRSDPFPLHVVYPQNRHLSAKERVFVEWIAEPFAVRKDLGLYS